MRERYTITIEFFIATDEGRLDEEQTGIEEIAQDIARRWGRTRFITT